MSAYLARIGLVSVSDPYIGYDTDTNYRHCDTNLIHDATKLFIYKYLKQYQTMVPFNDTDQISDNCK